MRLKAYNPAWPLALAAREQAARWQRQQLLSAAQQAQIEAAYPLDFYRPGWPLRVGLFLASCLAISTGSGFIAAWSGIFFNEKLPWLLGGMLFVGGCLFMLEHFIRAKQHFRSGVDNALLYSALGGAALLIFHVFDTYIFNHQPLRISSAPSIWPLLCVLAAMVAALVRYADALVAAVAFGVSVSCVGILAMQSALGHALLPFLLMLAAAAALYGQGRLARRPDASYYHSVLLTAKVMALALFYLAGNYYAVREGNAALAGLATSTQIPFAPLFYCFTAIIPLAYIAFGLRRHDRLLLLTGLLALAFSIFTLRYYRSLLPPEIAAIIGGAILILGAGAGLRYLRPARFGLTSEPDDEPRHFNLENLIVSQTATVPDAPAPGFQFGGGQSGGGGATGSF